MAIAHKNIFAATRINQGFCQVAENSPIGIYVEFGGFIVNANFAAAALFGVKQPADLLGRESNSLFHPEWHGAIRDRCDDFKEADPLDPRLSVRCVRADGSHFDAQVSHKRIEWDGEPTVVVHVQDVTKQNETEQRLRESEARYRGIIDLATDAIISIDKSGRIQLFNRGAESIFGFAADEIVGQSIERLLPERFRDAHGQHLSRFIASPEVSRLMDQRSPVLGLRKDGTEFAAEASISKLDQPGGTVLTVMLRDITERKRVEDDLRAAKTRAENAARSKSEFLANVSHELLTPLNAILGFSEFLVTRRTAVDGGIKFQEYATDIHNAGLRLLALVNDVLDLARNDTGNLHLDEEEIDVEAIIRACIVMVHDRAQAADIRLIEEFFSEPHLRLRADPRRLKQILSSLLTNAVKFTAPGGTVIVRNWHSANDGFVLQVIDTGIGIATEDIPKVLRPFERVDSALTRREEGAGIGLSLAKLLVEQHGGSLDLQSLPRKGTTVTVRLPASRIVSVAA